MSTLGVHEQVQRRECAGHAECRQEFEVWHVRGTKRTEAEDEAGDGRGALASGQHEGQPVSRERTQRIGREERDVVGRRGVEAHPLQRRGHQART
jgi:hypothetical protein